MKSVESMRKDDRRYARIAGALILVLVFFFTRTTAQTGAITLAGGNQTMNITSSVMGAEPTVVMNTSATLQYWRQAVNAKITVATLCASQSFNLSVVATGVSRGNAAPAVDLTDGMPAVDFITDIRRVPSSWTSATATLQYTASATFSQGNSAEMGNDIHVVTYTIVAQ